MVHAPAEFSGRLVRSLQSLVQRRGHSSSGGGLGEGANGRTAGDACAHNHCLFAFLEKMSIPTAAPSQSQPFLDLGLFHTVARANPHKILSWVIIRRAATGGEQSGERNATDASELQQPVQLKPREVHPQHLIDVMK